MVPRLVIPLLHIRFRHDVIIRQIREHVPPGYELLIEMKGNASLGHIRGCALMTSHFQGRRLKGCGTKHYLGEGEFQKYVSGVINRMTQVFI